jgi:hypothetical protein
MDTLVKTMQAECAKAPPKERGQCFGKYQAQMEALNKEIATGTAQSAPTQGRVVCSELKLKAVGGKLTGTADNCAGSNGVQVSGTYKPGSGK